MFRVDDILEATICQNFRWGEIPTLWASSLAKKVLLTAEKVGSAKIDEIFGWGKTHIFKRAAQKRPKFNMG